MKLYDTGVYLQNGQEIIPENQANLPVAKEEAAKNTIAYSILKAHNKSDNMEKLQIKFDKLTSHDITFVGIIQEVRWSLCTASSGSYPSVCKRDACRRRKDDPRFRQPYKIRSTWNHGHG